MEMKHISNLKQTLRGADYSLDVNKSHGNCGSTLLMKTKAVSERSLGVHSDSSFPNGAVMFVSYRMSETHVTIIERLLTDVNIGENDAVAVFFLKASNWNMRFLNSYSMIF